MPGQATCLCRLNGHCSLPVFLFLFNEQALFPRTVLYLWNSCPGCPLPVFSNFQPLFQAPPLTPQQISKWMEAAAHPCCWQSS